METSPFCDIKFMLWYITKTTISAQISKCKASLDSTALDYGHICDCIVDMYIPSLKLPCSGKAYCATNTLLISYAMRLFLRHSLIAYIITSASSASACINQY